MKTRQECEARHREALELRAEGYLMKQIADKLERHYSTIVHHLSGDCSCDLPAYNGLTAMRQPILWAVLNYGPIRASALAAIMAYRPDSMRMALRRLEAEGLVVRGEYEGGYLWRIASAPAVNARYHIESQSIP